MAPAPTTPFFDCLEARVKSIDSLLCVGLDPHAAQVSHNQSDMEQLHLSTHTYTQPTYIKLSESTGPAAYAFCKRLIETTLPSAAAYKPNIAFFEALGQEGWQALLDVMKLIPAEVPVLLDAKRGDISTTADAYATACLEGVGATGVTLHGYMGVDSVAPFMKDPRTGAFVLCKTSNPSSADFQTLKVTSSSSFTTNKDVFLYEEVAARASEWDHQFNNRIGLVVGATDIEALSRVRTIVPHMWILAPGIGAQGGDLEAACAAGLSVGGSKLLLPISRGISKATDPGQAAEDFRKAINAARSTHKKTPTTSTTSTYTSRQLKAYQTEFIQFAMASQVLLLGSFTLKSGRISPYFFNAGKFTSVGGWVWVCACVSL